jgi:hypothetical protein
VTSHFQQWFALPVDYTAVPEWQTYSLPWEQFLGFFASRDVPPHLLKIIHAALQTKLPLDTNADPHGLLVTPSLNSFVEAIKSARADSIGGLTGLSYNMIKKWPPHLLAAAHSALSALWDSRSIPDFWKWKWLVPIPKKADPTLNELRPLTLIEVTRKIWSSIFVRRLQDLWTIDSPLEPSQHGFLRGRGCDTALSSVLNALETAKETTTTVYITSWDMRRAFDSVERSLLVFAWVRLGVPSSLAEYIVGMEMDGTAVVRTPWAQRFLRNHHWSQEAISALGFQPQRGTGQGDIPSPLLWVGVFDILLTALSTITEGLLYASGGDGTSSPVPDSAYADDLLSIVADKAALQHKADIVSAFCSLFGIVLSHDKFRAFRVCWGNAQAFPQQETIVIHTPRWVATTIPLQPSGTMKYLGVTFDMDLSNTTQYQTAVHTLQTSCALLRSRKASLESKTIALLLRTYRQVEYYARFMAWTLAQYE